MAQTYLFVVFSSTPYRIGRFIRRFTGEPYNHVSISLNESLSPMYSFARRYYRTPFYGGFVKESLSRHHVNGQASTIQVCKLPITRRQYCQLRQKLNAMYSNREQYLYNHLSMFTLPFGRLAPVRDAYICAQFCAKLLSTAGYPAEYQRYCSVGQLAKMLEPYTVYTGPVPDGEYDHEFYDPAPIRHPTLASLRSIAALFPRLEWTNAEK